MGTRHRQAPSPHLRDGCCSSEFNPAPTPTRYQEERLNPFQRHKNPETGAWQDPVYSSRRQAELHKMARDHGVEHLLPESNKAAETRLAHRVKHGLRVKGTGVGQKVKGHIHERHMISKMEKKRTAMLEMPQLIKSFKKTSKYKWTKWPK